MARIRMWLEAVSAAVAFVLAGTTLFVPDWIERLFEAEPDGGSGEAEWLISLAFAAVAVVLALLARRDHRLLARAAAAES